MKTLKEFTTWVEEETMVHTEFSIETLKAIPVSTTRITNKELAKIEQYVNHTLGQSAGKGSFRKIWIIDDNRILKLVKDADHVFQNQQEKMNTECVGVSYSAQVLDHHPQFYWLIEERVEPLSSSNFVAQFAKQLRTKLGPETKLADGVGMTTWFMITNVIGDLVSGKEDERYRNIYPLFRKSRWFTGLVKKLQGCNVSSEDFHYENWGIRPSTGEFVLLDLGF